VQLNKEIIYTTPITGVRVLRFKTGYYEAGQAWVLGRVLIDLDVDAAEVDLIAGITFAS